MNHKVLSHKDSFDIVLDKLKSGLPFSFVRFGDGDHIIMYRQSLNKIVGGGNRFIVTEKLQRELIDCYNIDDSDFLVGTMLNDKSNYQMRKTQSDIDHGRLPNELIERYDMLAMSCLFETLMSNLSRFTEFAREMRKTRTLFICSYNHPNITSVYGNGEYIKVTPINCYSNIDDWYPDVLKSLHKVDKVVLSAGFCGRVIAKRLWKIGVRMPVLDVGSLSDAFIFDTHIAKNINLRSFMTQIKPEIDRRVNELYDNFVQLN